jgi:CRP-like cAMP-binding protein
MGEVLFTDGDTADAFLVISEGSVKVFMTSARGTEMLLCDPLPWS